MLFASLTRSPVARMTTTCDLALQSYLVELTRVRTLAPDQLAGELNAMTPLWAPVTVSSSTT